MQLLAVWRPCSQVHSVVASCVPMPPGGKDSSAGDLLGETLSPFDDGMIGDVAFLGGQSIEERIRAARGVAAIGLGWWIGAPPWWVESSPWRYLCRSTGATYHPNVLMLMTIANGAIPMSLWCISHDYYFSTFFLSLLPPRSRLICIDNTVQGNSSTSDGWKRAGNLWRDCPKLGTYGISDSNQGTYHRLYLKKLPLNNKWEGSATFILYILKVAHGEPTY